ncbi:hypothetical protein EDB82DRAFT_488914 [Fusarium venenatum]|uniref:uncharacterized protein n=1 Tax=Fusarium venenatum TaxID=56646 RepID=UPI001D768727|nr:hypothetical protein EDB82DRAFT_488914 [Fusarium venenatum]
MHISLGPLIVWYCLTARFCLMIHCTRICTDTVPSPCLTAYEPTEYKAFWCLVALPLRWGPRYLYCMSLLAVVVPGVELPQTR